MEGLWGEELVGSLHGKGYLDSNTKKLCRRTRSVNKTKPGETRKAMGIKSTKEKRDVRPDKLLCMSRETGETASAQLPTLHPPGLEASIPEVIEGHNCPMEPNKGLGWLHCRHS
jgi:hypothetical protein